MFSWNYGHSKSHFYDLDDDQYLIKGSVLNYGIRDFTGLSSENLSLRAVENVIYNSLIAYEPRLIPDELEVRAVSSDSESKKINSLSFEITGKIWAEPLPQDFVLRTEMSLDTGSASVV